MSPPESENSGTLAELIVYERGGLGLMRIPIPPGIESADRIPKHITYDNDPEIKSAIRIQKENGRYLLFSLRVSRRSSKTAASGSEQFSLATAQRYP